MTNTLPSLAALRDKTLTIERELEAPEYQEYERARDLILRFWSDYELLIVVVMNYLDFEDYMKHAPDLASLRQHRDIRAEVNRRILNLLASFRSFLDHSEGKLRRRYGEKSVQYEHFDQATHRMYDTFFCYRFLYELRNYVQHCGMPLGLLGYKASITDLETQVTERTLTISFDRDRLLGEWQKWKAPLRNEISQMPAQIPINPLLKELISCLQQLHSVIVEDELPALRQAAAVIQAMIAPVVGTGRPVLVCVERGEGRCFTAKDGRVYPTTDFRLEHIPILRIDQDSMELTLDF